MELQVAAFKNLTEIPVAENIIPLCELAKNLAEAGDFENACETLQPFWAGLLHRPDTAGLPQDAEAELLLRTGTLTGWLGSMVATTMIFVSRSRMTTVPAIAASRPTRRGFTATSGGVTAGSSGRSVTKTLSQLCPLHRTSWPARRPARPPAAASRWPPGPVPARRSAADHRTAAGRSG